MVDVSLDSVTREFGGVTALDDVDVHVRDGEFFTLVGPSGCGKTTTLRIVAGLEQPTEGSVEFGDRDVAGTPPEERNVGVVFQNYALFPHMTVAENVAYGLRFSDPPDGVSTDDRVQELLELVDLAGFDDRRPDQLSGGQRQRISLARALAPDPDVLLLDEPMSALDARLRERLRLQVKRIQEELGTTTIYVTHDQEEALAVSDRVAVMNDGHVEQVDTPTSIYREPATQFTASFIGDNNLFEGTVVDRDGDRVRVNVNGHDFLVADADDGNCSFCVRPQALSVNEPENRLQAAVETIEFLGESFRTHLDWNEQSLVMYTDERPHDGTVEIGFAPESAHVIE